MPNKTKNILIRGAIFENKGAEAMLRTVQQEMARRIPESDFFIEDVPFRYQQNIPFSYGFKMPNSYGFRMPYSPLSTFKLVAKFGRSLLLRPSLIPLLRARTVAWSLSHLPPLDAIVDISGFAYSDSWSSRLSRNAAYFTSHCRQAHIPCFYLPQAWGPFENPAVAFWARRIVEQADLICPREPQSQAHIEALVGKNRSNVRLCSDVAFIFTGASADIGKALLAHIGIQRGAKPLIGIVPNMRVYERAYGAGLSNAYVQVLGVIAKRFIDRIGAIVILAPNEQTIPGQPHWDDHYLCSLVELLIDDKESCRVVRDYMPAENFKALWGEVDFLLSSRFHALIFARSQGIPVAALGWSHKYEELFKDFGLSEYVFDHDKLDPKTLWDAIEKAWNSREETKAKILKVLPSIRTSVEKLFDFVAERIQDDRPKST